MEPSRRWDRIWTSRPVETASWFQAHAEQSLRLIRETGLPSSAPIIDVGGGASTLADDLLRIGYSALTVLDVSAAALAAARRRLGSHAGAIRWIEADITKFVLPVDAYDVWHDRAVFHFLTSPADRRAYVDAVLRAVKPRGHVIVATFAEDGPTHCSGLPVMRYRAEELHAQFGTPFTLLRHEKEEHHTPAGSVQKFVYCHFRKNLS